MLKLWKKDYGAHPTTSKILRLFEETRSVADIRKPVHHYRSTLNTATANDVVFGIILKS